MEELEKEYKAETGKDPYVKGERTICPPCTVKFEYYSGHYVSWLEKKIKQTTVRGPADSVTPVVAKKIIKARDAFIKEDYQEAYHQIYSIASPEFCKNCDDVWKELEELAKEAK